MVAPRPTVDTNVGPNGTANGARGARDRAFSRSANDNIERFPASPATQTAGPFSASSKVPCYELFTENTRALVYGLQPKAVQGMLDFDFICRRKTPSVAGIIYPFGGQFILKQYWGTKETLVDFSESF
jgi:CoA binding domain